MSEVDLYTYIISRTVSTIFRSLPVISPVTMKEVNTFFDADVASLFVTFHLSMLPLSVIYADCPASTGLSEALVYMMHRGVEKGGFWGRYCTYS